MQQQITTGVLYANLRRLKDEAEELQSVCLADSPDCREALDELVDVLYFVKLVQKEVGISDSQIALYGQLKSAFRDTGAKNKAFELAMAGAVLGSTK